ncbi:MAG: hypothetical protein RI952_1521 [Bacteroidota bacterium]|jgi:uncharacterized membrane protein
MGINRFSKDQQQQVKVAIENAELQTSCEIRVFVEDFSKIDVLDRAAFQFKKLAMHETALRNGVLIYLATEDKKFAIIGDAGINQHTGNEFWDSVKELMLAEFKKEDLTTGLIIGIAAIAEKVKLFFPYEMGDKNEISNDIAH